MAPARPSGPGGHRDGGRHLGFGAPELDYRLDIAIALFEFPTQDAARSLPKAIATAAVSVAGIAFSVPNLSVTLAVLLALLSSGLFTAFIGPSPNA